MNHSPASNRIRPPDVEKYPVDAGLELHTVDFLRVSMEEVARNFLKYDLLDSQVQFLKGWSKDTLPSAPIDKIAIARLARDMYSSTMDSLASLYPKVSPDGYIIIDDYAISCCAAAVHDFRSRHQIQDPLIQIDYYGAYWRKSK